MASFRPISSWLLAGSLVLAGGSALAAPSPKEKADARALVTDAKKALKEKRLSDAADAFRQADELDPSPQTKLDLAHALIDQGKLLDGSKLLHALNDSPDAGNFAAKKASEAAKKLLEEVEPRIPWVQVTIVGPDAAKAKVQLDSNEVDATSEIPADPGDHKISVSADGFETAGKKVTLAEGVHEQVRIELTRSASSPNKAAGGTESSMTSKIPGIAVLGAGVVLLGVGIGFGVDAMGKASDARLACTGGICTSTDAKATRSASVTSGNVATGLFIVGGAAIAGGVVLLLVLPVKKDPPKAGLHLTPLVGPGALGLAGEF